MRTYPMASPSSIVVFIIEIEKKSGNQCRYALHHSFLSSTSTEITGTGYFFSTGAVSSSVFTGTSI
jgi:hypothetical protein